KIKKNEPVLFDFSAIHNGYHMDETRMLVMGKMDDKQMDVCKKTMEILFALVPEMKPGVTMESIYERSLDHAKKLGIGEGFLGLPEIKSRFIGHGIGIELVESPYLAKGHSSPLEAGMVFAVEPKFIQKEEFGVGIESVVMVTPQGGEFISTTEHKVFVCK
ncbi:MAG: aminopeptidase P family protein, partial [Desulfobacteraceae bacterium]|nr:aminopeptidase P family protein [Desulfobacteraceae bacterium]